MLEAVRRLVAKLVAPLRVDGELDNFTLSNPESATTTYDGGYGWHERPPAVLRCPGCAGEIRQGRATSSIECAECWVQRSDDEFSDLQLLALECPRCGTEMEHGWRHPQTFDVPEWATCDSCHYHWELNHWY